MTIMRYVLISLVFLLQGCQSEQLSAIGWHFVSSLAFIVPVGIFLIILIFVMNRYITTDRGYTDERKCAIVGAILFPIIFIITFGLKFGFNWISVSISGVIGAGIGWFSYTLDELIENFWENRDTTLPAALGLIVAGWFTVVMFTMVWLEGDFYAAHKANTNRIVVERYDCTGTGKDETCSWDYYTHVDKTVLGEIPIPIKEGIDYKLERGDYLKKDRIRREQYKFIGGYFYSEKKSDWKRVFEWLRPARDDLAIALGRVNRIQSDFYGNPIANKGVINSYKEIPPSVKKPHLPQDDVIPRPTTIGKTFDSTATFFKLLITEDEYRPLSHGFFGINSILIAIAVFYQPLRRPIIIFFVCASIVILIIIMGVAAKTGSIPGIGDRKRRSSGGGGFSGRSLSG